MTRKEKTKKRDMHLSTRDVELDKHSVVNLRSLHPEEMDHRKTTYTI